MFHNARIKLTAWYLLIIMTVSFLFSAMIYQLLNAEVQRIERMQRNRIEHGFGGFMAPLPVNEELLEESRHRILVTLFTINGVIFVTAGGLGYLLAGRTLRPIKEMIDEQNRFISDASHELRTPITSLKTAFEVFLRSKSPSIGDAKGLITESVEEVNRLHTLSDSLLVLSRYDQPNSKGAFETIKLNTILKKAVHETKHIARKKQITVVHSDSSAIVWGNAASLTELFVILIDNAIKYSPPKSSIEIAVTNTSKSTAITVRDHGRGIARKDLPHIFDRFYRSDSARIHEDDKGYGLGLSIAEKITQRHGGSITVRSEPGAGSAFTVHLPIHTV